MYGGEEMESIGNSKQSNIKVDKKICKCALPLPPLGTEMNFNLSVGARREYALYGIFMTLYFTMKIVQGGA